MLKRLELAAIGGFVGLLFWVFFDYLPDRVYTGWLLHCATVFTTVFCIAVMALVGPEKPLRSVIPSIIIAGVAALLTWMGGLRFASSSEFFAAGHTVAALVAIVLISIPFAAARLQEKHGWKSYQLLFDGYWGIFIRFVAGWAFAGLILLVLYLSDELLKLVGVRIIGDLLDIDVVWYTTLGAVFGLGVATVYELREYVSPVLVHRLLRMLVPLVLAVVVVFLGALPFRGLSDLFGKLSTATVLMSVAFGAITLITTMIDRDEESASSSPFMLFSARALATLLPALVGLAVYAVWLRIAAYGWTPTRAVAAYAAVFLAGYSLYYAYAALSGKGWQHKLRQANIYMALAVCAGAVLWLTPLVSAERVSANSQLARYEAKLSKLDAVPFYELAHDWGKPGIATLDALASAGPAEVKAEALRAKEAKTSWDFRRENQTKTMPERRAALASRIAIRPASASIMAKLGDMPPYTIDFLERTCRQQPEPECVLVVLPKNRSSNSEAALFSRNGNLPWHIIRQHSQLVVQGRLRFDDNPLSAGQAKKMFEQIMANDFVFQAVSHEYLSLGGAVLFPDN